MAKKKKRKLDRFKNTFLNQLQDMRKSLRLRSRELNDRLDKSFYEKDKAVSDFKKMIKK